MRRIPLMLVGVVPAVSLITGVLYLLSPSPSFFLNIAWIDEILSRLFKEQTDRIILLSWWLTAFAMSGLALWLMKRPLVSYTRGRVLSCLIPASLVASLIISLVSMTWRADSHGVWPGIGLDGLLIGISVFFLSAWIWTASKSVALAISVGLVSLAGSIAFPALIQLPTGLLDPYHFVFIADEIAAPAAGKFPLSDYVPQYVTLLGWPVAPLLALLGSNAVFGVAGWLVLLQILTFAIAVLWVRALGGWRLLAPAFIMIVGPSITLSADFLGAISYFQTTPARIVLPLVAIVIAFRVLQGTSNHQRFPFVGALIAGVAAGIAALNNPDYGLPAVAAILLATALAVRPFRRALQFIALQLLGAIAIFVAYDVIGRVSGNAVSWSNWLVFQVVYGAQGHSWAEPIRPFGIHVAVVALFVGAVVLGVTLTVFGRSRTRPWALRQGIALFLVGSWSMLSLPYFVGRSLVPTLIGGYAFMIGLTGALLLPSIRSAVRLLLASGSRPSWDRIGAVALGSVVVVGVSAFWSLAPEPSASVDRIVRADSAFIVDQASGGYLRTEFEAHEDGDGKIVQIVDTASLVELGAGVPSASVPSNPLHLTTDPVFARQQCEWLVNESWNRIWLAPLAEQGMSSDSLCLEMIRFGSPLAVSPRGSLFERIP